mmetsp:Transcript_31211/g.75918  ORF Transcript_31211/g.75918 Transcript_31211/m.75918 type:complete len:212 (-) Transcript_31211:1144-1779(-)
MQTGVHTRDIALDILDHLANDHIPPAHECHLLAHLQPCCVIRLEEHRVREEADLSAQCLVFGVKIDRQGERLGRCAGQVARDKPVLEQARVPSSFEVDLVLVRRPDFAPLHQTRALGCPHVQDERLEALDSHSPTQHAGDSRKPSVVPPLDPALVDEPLQLALREQCAHEVDAREAPQLDVAQLQVLKKPPVLMVPIGVLAVAQSVSDAFQ